MWSFIRGCTFYEEFERGVNQFVKMADEEITGTEVVSTQEILPLPEIQPVIELKTTPESESDPNDSRSSNPDGAQSVSNRELGYQLGVRYR